MAASTPAATAARKEESRDKQFCYPRRCELPGCEVTAADQLKRCAACKAVNYCCLDHQREDWSQHKEECKVFQRTKARPTFYTDDEMLARYPLEKPETQLRPPAVPPGSTCNLCGRTDAEQAMTRTRCCHRVVCDSERQYQLLSFSRDFCPRNHTKYTLCGNHHKDMGCNMKKDWRECPRCTQQGKDKKEPGQLWDGLNAYNYMPLLSKDVPRHGLCHTCGACSRKFMLSLEGGSMSMRSGAVGWNCSACQAQPFRPARAVPAS